jgi:hypothetical protein
LQLGYATLLVNQESDGALAFYGTELKIQRLGDNNQLEIRFITFNPTSLCTTDASGAQQCNNDGSGSLFGPNTVCPNTRTLSQNQNSNVPWEHMLRSLPPPTPPVCVPSPYADCPQSSLSDLASALQESGSGLGEEPGR